MRKRLTLNIKYWRFGVLTLLELYIYVMLSTNSKVSQYVGNTYREDTKA